VESAIPVREVASVVARCIKRREGRGREPGFEPSRRVYLSSGFVPLRPCAKLRSGNNKTAFAARPAENLAFPHKKCSVSNATAPALSCAHAGLRYNRRGAGRVSSRCRLGGGTGVLRAAISQHPFRRPQHLQSSTTSYLSVHTADLQSRSGRPVARCRCRRMKRGLTSPPLWTPPVTVTMPLSGILAASLRPELSTPQ
jgi:hypothetical protein